MRQRARGRAIGRTKERVLRTARLIEAPNPKDDAAFDLPTADSRIGIAVLDWWEAPRWHEVPDEYNIWGDPSPETVRTVKNLRRGNKMDT